MKYLYVFLIVVVLGAGVYFAVFGFRGAAVPERTADSQEMRDTENTAQQAEGVVFVIDEDASQVTFQIGEVLSGNEVNVVGQGKVTGGAVALNILENQIEGVQFVDLITIDAASFTTDSAGRDAAIKRFILKSDDYPVITFLPTEVISPDFPITATSSEVFSGLIAGELTIRGVSRDVRLPTEIKISKNNEFIIKGIFVLRRDDFALTIPEVPFVASVEEEVVVEFHIIFTK